jgi:hypothetical protein
MYEEKERPPIFKKWSGWYALVIGFLVALIIFFVYFTKYFA